MIKLKNQRNESFNLTAIRRCRLLWFLRDEQLYRGQKYGCGTRLVAAALHRVASMAWATRSCITTMKSLCGQRASRPSKDSVRTANIR